MVERPDRNSTGHPRKTPAAKGARPICRLYLICVPPWPLEEDKPLPRDVINPPGLPAVNPTYNQAIRANGFVFVAGQIGIVPGTGRLVSDDIAEQARQALDNTATVLEAAGSSLSKIVSSSLFLTEFEQLSRKRRLFEVFPASRTGQVRLWRHNTLRRRQIRDTGHCTGVGSNRFWKEAKGGHALPIRSSSTSDCRRDPPGLSPGGIRLRH